MKNLFRNQAIRVLTLMIVFGMGITSCSSSDDDPTPSTKPLDATLVATMGQYVDNVIVETYKNLADNALKLAATTKNLKSDANVEKAAKEWKAARKYWEQSEAFLFGAAADYGIDPHIDSWPLDKASLDNLLANAQVMASFDADAVARLGGGLLGFHAVEYVLFKDGKAKKASEITANEAKYCAEVASDLANQAVRLEAAWAGMDKVSAAKQKVLKDAELEPTRNYGTELKAAGIAGNTLYPTQQAGIAEVLSGAITIADEVGAAKITDPVASKNVLDVESWYSWNSLEDFQDNIRSIQNAYLGGVEGKRDAAKSVSAYVKTLNPTLDAEIKAAITTAIKDIKAIGFPFRNHLDNKAGTDKAIASCATLVAKLEAAKTAVNAAK